MPPLKKCVRQSTLKTSSLNLGGLIMKKIYVALAVLGTLLLSSCVREKNFSDITVNENDIAFVMQGVSTRSAEGESYNVTRGISIPMGEGLFLEETIEELNPTPATRGIPAYTVNLGSLYKTMGVYAQGNFGDATFEKMDTEQYTDKEDNTGWRYWHNYGSASPWPDKTTDKVDFYLRMPAADDAVEYDKSSFKLTSPKDGKEQADLLFGHVLMSKEDHDAKLPGGMPVTMKHALTGIKFANGHPNGTMTKTIITKVELIGLNTYGEGTIDDDGYVIWEEGVTPVLSTENAPFYLEFDNPEYSKSAAANNPDGTVNTTGDKKWDSSLDGTSWTAAAADHNLNHTNGELTFWFIPQEITDNVVLKVYFTVKTPDSVDGFLSDACHTIYLGEMLNEKYQSVEGNAGKNLKWEAGQLRTYTLKPFDVDVDIKDTMTEDTKSGLHIANTGNVDEYVRMLIMGNWYGWMPDEDPEKDEPSILVGYKYKDAADAAEHHGSLSDMVDPWYREGYDHDGDGTYEDPYGDFDPDFHLAALGARDGVAGDWADASGGFYYTMPIGPGAGVNDAVSATKNLFETYKVDEVPTIYLATSTTERVAAVGVHLRMEIVVQAIAVPTETRDGVKKNVFWLDAWQQATGVNKLLRDYEDKDGNKPNAKYVEIYETGAYDVTYE